MSQIERTKHRLGVLNPSIWWSLRPFGIGEERPNNFAELPRALVRNAGQLGYAYRILSRGVCDGCALGTTGLRDFTLDGIHLCNVRLRLLHLNTMRAFDPKLLEDPDALLESGKKLEELGRLPCPLVRHRGDRRFSPISWEDALSLAAERLRRAPPERLAFYLTSRGIPNETYYAAQKAARALGTNSIDNAARLCHAASTVALKGSLGVAASTCSYQDWIDSDLIVFFGSNVANNQPVATKYLHHARARGAKIAVVNSYREPGMERYWIPSIPESALFGTRLAEHFFLVHVGGDLAFITGVLKHLFENSWHDARFIDDHTTGFAAFEAAVRAQSFDDLEERSGASRASMLEFAALLRDAKRAVFVWSMGITQHESGVDGVRAIVHLALSKGFVGRDGAGLMPIRGHSGVQGGGEMGAYATAFPGGRPIDADGARELGNAWGFEVPSTRGLTAPEMIGRAHEGKLDVLFSVGGNFVDVLPDPTLVRAALARVTLRVHMDIVLTRQMLLPSADTVLLLPAMTRYEIPGGVTETTTERRVIFSPEIPGPRVAEARFEGATLLELARRARPELAAYLGAPSTAELRAEIARMIPSYDGIQRLEKQGDAFQIGGRHLCRDGVFPTDDGRARFVVPELKPNAVPAGMFRVATRRGKQFNSLVQEDRDALTGAERDAVFLNQADGARLGVSHGDPVRLRNERGQYQGRAFFAPLVPGNVELHWPEGNVLLDFWRTAPDSGAPDYNTYAHVERVEPPPA